MKVFLKNLTKINIFFKYDQNRHFGIFWPKSRIFDNFDQNWDLGEFLIKSTYLQILTQIDIFGSLY